MLTPSCTSGEPAGLLGEPVHVAQDRGVDVHLGC